MWMDSLNLTAILSVRVTVILQRRTKQDQAGSSGRWILVLVTFTSYWNLSQPKYHYIGARKKLLKRFTLTILMEIYKSIYVGCNIGLIESHGRQMKLDFQAFISQQRARVSSARSLSLCKIPAFNSHIKPCLTLSLPIVPLIDFTLSNARRFYLSMGNPTGLKGLTSTR